MAKLDSPQLRADLLTAMGKHGKRAEAAEAVGITRRTLSSYCKANPGFGLELDAAARRARVIAHHAPAMEARGDVAPPPAELDLFSEAKRRWFLEQLELHASDPTSRGCAKALDVLAQLHFARDLLALKAEMKRSEDAGQGDRRPLVVWVPVPVRGAIDAEVVGQSE